MTGERMNRLADRWFPPIRTLHPYPEQRLRVMPEVGAQCVSSARWDLCGGPPVRAVPTAKCAIPWSARIILMVLRSSSCPRFLSAPPPLDPFQGVRS